MSNRSSTSSAGRRTFSKRIRTESPSVRLSSSQSTETLRVLGASRLHMDDDDSSGNETLPDRIHVIDVDNSLSADTWRRSTDASGDWHPHSHFDTVTATDKDTAEWSRGTAQFSQLSDHHSPLLSPGDTRTPTSVGQVPHKRVVVQVSSDVPNNDDENQQQFAGLTSRLEIHSGGVGSASAKPRRASIQPQAEGLARGRSTRMSARRRGSVMPGSEGAAYTNPGGSVTTGAGGQDGGDGGSRATGVTVVVRHTAEFTGEMNISRHLEWAKQYRIFIELMLPIVTAMVTMVDPNILTHSIAVVIFAGLVIYANRTIGDELDAEDCKKKLFCRTNCVHSVSRYSWPLKQVVQVSVAMYAAILMTYTIVTVAKGSAFNLVTHSTTITNGANTTTTTDLAQLYTKNLVVLGAASVLHILCSWLQYMATSAAFLSFAFVWSSNPAMSQLKLNNSWKVRASSAFWACVAFVFQAPYEFPLLRTWITSVHYALDELDLIFRNGAMPSTPGADNTRSTSEADTTNAPTTAKAEPICAAKLSLFKRAKRRLRSFLYGELLCMVPDDSEFGAQARDELKGGCVKTIYEKLAKTMVKVTRVSSARFRLLSTSIDSYDVNVSPFREEIVPFRENTDSRREDIDDITSECEVKKVPDIEGLRSRFQNIVKTTKSGVNNRSRSESNGKPSTTTKQSDVPVEPVDQIRNIARKIEAFLAAYDELCVMVDAEMVKVSLDSDEVDRARHDISPEMRDVEEQLRPGRIEDPISRGKRLILRKIFHDITGNSGFVDAYRCQLHSMRDPPGDGTENQHRFVAVNDLLDLIESARYATSILDSVVRALDEIETTMKGASYHDERDFKKKYDVAYSEEVSIACAGTRECLCAAAEAVDKAIADVEDTLQGAIGSHEVNEAVLIAEIKQQKKVNFTDDVETTKKEKDERKTARTRKPKESRDADRKDLVKYPTMALRTYTIAPTGDDETPSKYIPSTLAFAVRIPFSCPPLVTFMKWMNRVAIEDDISKARVRLADAIAQQNVGTVLKSLAELGSLREELQEASAEENSNGFAPSSEGDDDDDDFGAIENFLMKDLSDLILMYGDMFYDGSNDSTGDDAQAQSDSTPPNDSKKHLYVTKNVAVNNFPFNAGGEQQAEGEVPAVREKGEVKYSVNEGAVRQMVEDLQKNQKELYKCAGNDLADNWKRMLEIVVAPNLEAFIPCKFVFDHKTKS